MPVGMHIHVLRTCTRAWKRTREWLLMSAMALAWRACQASSLSSLRLMVLFSSVSSQDSAITVQQEPPAQPYRDAFWNLGTAQQRDQRRFFICSIKIFTNLTSSLCHASEITPLRVIRVDTVCHRTCDDFMRWTHNGHRPFQDSMLLTSQASACLRPDQPGLPIRRGPRQSRWPSRFP